MSESKSLEKESYKQRKKLFKKQLIYDLTKTCYVVLLFKFFHYSDSTFILVLRLIATRMIKEFFPKARETINAYQRSASTDSPAEAEFTSSFELPLTNMRISRTIPTPTPVVTTSPDGLTVTNHDSSSASPETAAHRDTAYLNERLIIPLSNFLFHVTVTLNMLIIIYRIIFPVDFKKLNDTGRYTLMIDFLSEYRDFSKYNNFRSNLFIIILEVLVLLIQFSVLQMTCIDDPEEDDENDSNMIADDCGDGFDGEVNVVTINIAQSFEKLRQRLRTFS